MKFPSLTKRFFKICPKCNKKINTSDGWTQFFDPDKRSGLPEGYYHLQCAPKIQHSKEIESVKQIFEKSIGGFNRDCDCPCHLPNPDGIERDNLYCTNCEEKH